MIQKIKNLRKEVIRKVAQKIADVMVYRLQTLVDLEDDNVLFQQQFEMAAKLNAYCIVFHDIYLD
jgi:hypothetical protein